MGTQHAQRVVAKRNTCTEDTYNNIQSQYIKSVAYTKMHNSSYRMHVHVTMFVSVCTSITRQV